MGFDDAHGCRRTRTRVILGLLLAVALVRGGLRPEGPVGIQAPRPGTVLAHGVQREGDVPRTSQGSTPRGTHQFPGTALPGERSRAPRPSTVARLGGIATDAPPTHPPVHPPVHPPGRPPVRPWIRRHLRSDVGPDACPVGTIDLRPRSGELEITMDGGAAKIRLEDLFPREFRALDVCQGPGGTLFVCGEDLSSRSGLILTLRYGLDIPKVRWTDSLELGDAALAAGAMALVPGEPSIAMVLDTLRGTLLRVNLRGGGVETVATSSDVPWLAEMDTLDITLPCTPIPHTPAPPLEYHVYHFARLAAFPGEARPLARTSHTYHPYAEGYVLDIGADQWLEIPTPQR